MFRLQLLLIGMCIFIGLFAKCVNTDSDLKEGVIYKSEISGDLAKLIGVDPSLQNA